MAQVVTITNPVTGQPTQVDQLEHTAQQIDDGIGFEDTDYPGCYYRLVNGVVEWLNPPIKIDTEYRTTERYLGKPVYVKLVDFGPLPNAAKQTIPHGASYVDQCFSVEGSVIGNGKNLNGLEGLTALYRNGNNLIAITNANMSDLTAYVLMKYTKTTD